MTERAFEAPFERIVALRQQNAMLLAPLGLSRRRIWKSMEQQKRILKAKACFRMSVHLGVGQGPVFLVPV